MAGRFQFHEQKNVGPSEALERPDATFCDNLFNPMPVDPGQVGRPELCVAAGKPYPFIDPSFLLEGAELPLQVVDPQTVHEGSSLCEGPVGSSLFRVR